MAMVDIQEFPVLNEHLILHFQSSSNVTQMMHTFRGDQISFIIQEVSLFKTRFSFGEAIISFNL